MKNIYEEMFFFAKWVEGPMGNTKYSNNDPLHIKF